MHSLSVGDALAMDAHVTLDGVPQDACTYASEHAGYVRRLMRRDEDGRVAEETVAGDVRITFPGLTPEQVEERGR
jgi:hypothetical protein